jgi:hypothetical protein
MDVLKVAVSAKLLIQLARRDVISEVFVEFEFFARLLSIEIGSDFERARARREFGGGGVTRGSMNGLINVKKIETNLGTNCRQ